MAQKGVQLDQEAISCSICLDLLKDPVTTPCGHSYCMNCIKGFWDGEDEKKIYSCPQCRQTFTPRPVLMKNTMLAVLVEKLKKTGLQAAPADHCYAGPEDVACDFCTGRKLKALKSCLMCLASYCEKHLQPHYDSAPFKKHKLVEPSKKLQENICSRHDEVMKMFCRTDQQCICYLCSVDEHKGHDTVSAAAERTERQRELEVSRLNIQQRIQDREKDVKLLQQEVKAVNRSADKAVEDSEKIFTELIRLMEKRSCDVKQQVRSQQKSEVSRVKELQEKLEQEITELKRRDAELKLLSHTEDHDQFLLHYPSLSPLSESTHSSSINIRPLSYFEDVTAAVSEVRDKLQDVLREKWTNVSQTVTEVDVLLPQPEPKTRAGLLKYSREITLDPKTAYPRLLLSEGNRKATFMRQHQSYSSHPDRFTHWEQVLSRESLTGRCYWEVEWRGGAVYVAVAYKSIRRAGVGANECVFGGNDKSWALDCDQNSYIFWYNKGQTPVLGPPSFRVGVYLDHSAGILSFYSVSETMTLLHRVQTTFTEPLYAGLRLHYCDDTAELCKLKMFCRTDQQSICYLCLMDEHKGHDTVSAAAERTERQRELEVSRLNIQQRIQDREKDVKLLQQEVEAVNRSADKAVEDSEKIFTELIRLMEKRSCDVKQQVRSQQKSEVSRVKELQEKLEQEITELKRRDAELKLLSHTEDPNQFLLHYPSLSPLSESTHSSSINIRPLSYFEDVTAAVSEVRDKLQDVLREKWTNVSQSVTEVDVLLPQPEPKTRAGFLQYSREITLDPGNRKATSMGEKQSYSSHPDRFTEFNQVLSRESLTGRCYWEVEWRGGGVHVAVAYKSIRRAGGPNECVFGWNDKSWALCCDQNSYRFWYNNINSPVSGPLSSRVGVYLDHSAGILSFYSVSETMTLLHRVQTTFTEPLFAGLRPYCYDTTAELCKLK
ncbi:tripartite motif-containing protein 16-like [Sebastes fasciatus]|uniref:tripartite motif-containing protein 16-like n=1 Tax=Sebastes fasciatus TaxID=394691 RepID=UPI003D9E10A0